MNKYDIDRIAVETGLHGMAGWTNQLYAFARAIADLQKVKDGDILSEAMQNDLEHGVKWLNEKAAKDFHEIYPALSAAICKINSPETDLDEALRRQ